MPDVDQDPTIARPGAIRTVGLRSSVEHLLAVIGAHPVVAVLILALVIRMAVAFTIMAFVRGTLIPDEHEYLDLAALAASGRLTPAIWDGYGQALFSATATFMWPLTALFWVFGPWKILGQLLAATFGAGTAALTTRLALPVMARRWAITAGVVVAVVPSQVLWSSVVLRESVVWLLLVIVSLACAGLLRATDGRGLTIATALGASAIFLLGHLRPQTMVCAAWAFGIVGILLAGRRVVRLRVAALGVTLLVPMLAGFGPAGLTLVRDAAPELARTRTNLAQGADSAIVPTTLLRVPTPVTGTPNDAGTNDASPTTIPEICKTAVCTASDTVSLADAGVAGDMRQLPRGLLATLVRPLPWEHTAGVSLLLARAENLGWYALYALAAVGMLTAIRRREALMAFPVVLGVGIAITSGLSQGNVGTAFRHRGQLLWIFAILAALAADELTPRWLTARRARQHSVGR